MPNPTEPPATLELTLLRAAFGKHAKKTVKRAPEGVFTVTDYTKGLSKWTRHVAVIPHDIDALGAFISATASDPSACLVTGTPSGNTPLETPAPRWKVDHQGEGSATLTECAAAWLPIDLDDIPTGTRLDPIDPETAIAAAVELLGHPFNSTSYIWQLTSRATPGSERTRARLYFLTDQAISNEQRRAWAKAVNTRTGLMLADASLYSANQPIYTAHPEFVDSVDPFPRRVGVCYGELEALPWADVETMTADTEATYTGARTGGPIPAGIDERLARIGDGPGKEGIDGPIYGAIVAMARAKWTAERIIEAVTEAVMTATVDPVKHPAEYLKRKTQPREIRRAIKNAERYLKRTETLPRVTQTRPLLEGEALPLGEATRRMQEAAAEFFASDAPGHTVVLGTVGLGKTRATVEARPPGAKTLWFHATHEQGQEVVDRINGKGLRKIAVKIEGRAGNDQRPGLCQRQAHLAALKDAGLAPFAERILCDSGTGRCEHFKACAYFAQFRQSEEVRLAPHDYLASNLHKAKVYKSDFLDGLRGAVVDESPLGAMIGKADAVMADIQIHAPVLAGVLATIQAGGSVDEEALAALELERAALSLNVMAPSASAAPQHDALLLMELESMAKNRNLTFAAIYKGVAEHLAGNVNLLWFGHDKDKRPCVFTAWKSELHPSLTRGLFLDATGSEDVYKALLGESTKIVRIHAHQNLDIIQASDAVMGKRRVIPNDEVPGSDGDLARIAALVRMLGKGVGVIGNKAAIEALERRGWLPKGTPTAHFGALRGLNRLEHCTQLVVFGRPEPACLDVERIARALWPSEELNLTGRYEWRGDGLLSVASHPDPRCDAVLRMIREGELLQAIGRLRAVRSMVTKRVYLLTSTPIDLPVTLRPLNEILPNEKLARLLLAGNGTAPMVPDMMARLVPDCWSTPGAAKLWLHRERVTFSYLSTLNYSFVTLKFRTRGQRCPSWALSTVDLDTARQTLQTLAGADIVDCQPAKTDRTDTHHTAPDQPPAPETIRVQIRELTLSTGERVSCEADIPPDRLPDLIAAGHAVEAIQGTVPTRAEVPPPDTPLIRRSNLYQSLIGAIGKRREKPFTRRQPATPDWRELAAGTVRTQSISEVGAYS